MRQRVRMLAHKSCVCVSSTSTVSFKMHCVELLDWKEAQSLRNVARVPAAGTEAYFTVMQYGVALASGRRSAGVEVAAWAGIAQW